jgi:6-phosphogluconolactonase
MASCVELPGAEVRLLATKTDVANAAADLILEASRHAISERGRFRLVLAGGTTPEAAYRRLAAEDADWGRWEVYHGDERCRPIDHAERNSVAANEALLDHVPIPAKQVYPIPAERGAEAAAMAYAAVVASALPFDLVLLGIGEDGHTASLFPGHPIPEDRLVIPVHDAPKPPPDRVSLTPTALAQCRRMLILVTGSGKRDALEAWRAGQPLPVARVAARGSALVLIDRDAAGDSLDSISRDRA